jgi:hypothetical protein
VSNRDDLGGDDPIGDMIAEVARAHGVAISREDPIVAVVLLNQVVWRRYLEETVAPAAAAIREATRDAIDQIEKVAEAQAHWLDQVSLQDRASFPESQWRWHACSVPPIREKSYDTSRRKDKESLPTRLSEPGRNADRHPTNWRKSWSVPDLLQICFDPRRPESRTCRNTPALHRETRMETAARYLEKLSEATHRPESELMAAAFQTGLRQLWRELTLDRYLRGEISRTQG